MKSRILTILTVALLLTPLIPAAAPAQTEFRKDFAQGYRAMRFDHLAALVKKNKFLIPGEVKALVEEASKGDKTFDEKMALLDLASAMAAMHKHWNGDERLMTLVEEAQREELRKENERKAEEEKWTGYVRYTGNILMRAHDKEMAAKGVFPVVFPHWVHRLYYECTACHSDIFRMKRGGEEITHEKMSGGRLCGRCHDGKTAFQADSGCLRCHLDSAPSSGRLGDSKGVDLKRVREIAGRLGALFRAEGLKGEGIPHDRFSEIDWEALRKTGVYTPIKTLKDGQKAEGLDNDIVFKPSMPGIDQVVFSHRTHSSRIYCADCHPAVFKDALGANEVTTAAMSEGLFCGYCHGKAAFRMADCKRCHRGAGEGEGAKRRPTGVQRVF